jgi:O-acetylhomoserine/O-acetylserine sulfhydrylase-like pyridoxal-dependent enzyme
MRVFKVLMSMYVCMYVFVVCLCLQAVSAIAKKHGILHACDSTFSTPIMVKPIAHGCDLVIQVRTTHAYTLTQSSLN